MHQSTISFKVLLISIMIIAGALGTICSNFQNSQYVYEGKIYKAFFHPYFQAATMSIALSIAGITYIVAKYIFPHEYQARQQEAVAKGLKLNMNICHLFIPAFFDSISSILQYTSLNFISASIFQMLKGGTVVTTFIFSVIFLKLKIRKFQIYGCILVLLGVLIIGVNNILWTNNEKHDEEKNIKQIIGFLLIGIAWISNASTLTYEQKLFREYHLQPLYVVGIQGIFHIVFMLFVITALSFFNCPFGTKVCVVTSQGDLFFQRPEVYFKQVLTHPLLLLAVIVSIFCSLINNVCGVSITKYINALARSICQISRTSLVWVIGIIVTISLGSHNPNYRWEKTGILPILIQLVGFTILILGNLTYNSLTKWPCFNQQYFQIQQEQNAKNTLQLDKNQQNENIQKQNAKNI